MNDSTYPSIIAKTATGVIHEGKRHAKPCASLKVLCRLLIAIDGWLATVSTAASSTHYHTSAAEQRTEDIYRTVLVSAELGFLRLGIVQLKDVLSNSRTHAKLISYLFQSIPEANKQALSPFRSPVAVDPVVPSIHSLLLPHASQTRRSTHTNILPNTTDKPPPPHHSRPSANQAAATHLSLLLCLTKGSLQWLSAPCLSLCSW